MARKRIGISDDFVLCRLAHSWEEYNDNELGPPAFGWRFSIRCVRCGAQRHDLIDSLGRLAGRRYIHPEGYRDAGIKGMKLDAFRRELALRRYGRKAVRRSA